MQASAQRSEASVQTGITCGLDECTGEEYSSSDNDTDEECVERREKYPDCNPTENFTEEAIPGYCASGNS